MDFAAAGVRPAVVIVDHAVHLPASNQPSVEAHFLCAVGRRAISMQRSDEGWGGRCSIAQTTRGHCGSIQFGLAISGGRIYSTGGSYGGYQAQLGGRVSPSGHVQVNAVAGPRSAHGAGRLGRFQGSGTWAGRGPSGVCSGVWSAARF